MSRAVRADELPKLKESVELEEFINTHCVHCRCYDGYDVCLNRRHWGTVIQNTVEYCNINRDYE